MPRPAASRGTASHETPCELEGMLSEGWRRIFVRHECLMSAVRTLLDLVRKPMDRSFRFSKRCVSIGEDLIAKVTNAIPAA